MIRTLLVVALAALTLAAPAAAEQVEITAQANAARAAFLLGATPPATVAAICMVDTGVNATPDTTAVIARLALEGEVTDRSPTLHGTQMAMFIGAARNQYGMVGLWPSARIVSVQANVANEDRFRAADYVRGIKLCKDGATAYGIKVILLALASPFDVSEEARLEFDDAVSSARASGMSVIAAAGNTAGAGVGTPASLPGVLSVGAADAAGTRCDFSATGAAILAPGCGIDGADPSTGNPTSSQQGTSVAAAVTAASLAALRSWRPDLAPDAAERVLVQTASSGALDLTRAFTAIGFPPPGEPSSPQGVPQATPTPTAAPPKQAKRRLPKPRFSVRMRGAAGRRMVVIEARNHPSRTRMKVEIYVRRGGKWRRIAVGTRPSSKIEIRARSWQRVTAKFSDPTRTRLSSRTAVKTR
jgi:hypothetical protein